jgi:hypothetical protein
VLYTDPQRSIHGHDNYFVYEDNGELFFGGCNNPYLYVAKGKEINIKEIQMSDALKKGVKKGKQVDNTTYFKALQVR